MKVVHATYSDTRGGAARASFRIHRALIDHGFDSRMVVEQAESEDYNVLSPTTVTDKLMGRIARRLNPRIAALQSSPNPIMHSPAVFSGSARRRIIREAPEVINLHWVGGGLLTVREIGKFNLPVVWRLPDMWAYCGAEHLDGFLSETRWKSGYSHGNRPMGHSGLDIDRWTWERKRRAWTRPFHLIAPSRWAADRVSESALLGTWPVTVIPNPIPLEDFRPQNYRVSRDILGLPAKNPLVLFGADGGASSPNKGFNLLERAMAKVAYEIPNVEAIVFGEHRPTHSTWRPCPIHWLGRIDDDQLLAHVYSAADVMVVPSRQEIFGQTGSEAQACGTPAVGFKGTGLGDVIDHRRTGFLARHLDTEDMANGIVWVLRHADRNAMAKESRRRATSLWDPRVVAAQYIEVYARALEEQSI